MEQQQPPTFAGGVELVRVNAVVFDRNGELATDLTAADFQITEGDEEHEIVNFEPILVRTTTEERPVGVPQPSEDAVSHPVAPAIDENRHVVLLFDDVHVSPSPTERIRRQLLSFVREARADDWVTIMTSSLGLNFTARTPAERKQLPVVIAALRGNLARDPFGDKLDDFQAMRMVEYGGRMPQEQAGLGQSGPDLRSGGLSREMIAEEKYAVAKRRIRQTLSSLGRAIQALEGFPGRKAVILYSEGFIKSPSMRDYDVVIGQALRSHVTLHVVDPRGLESGLPGAGDTNSMPGPHPLIALDTRAGGSSYLAASTGGRVSITNDTTQLLREAMIEAAASYVLGFAPLPGSDGERRIRVRVRREGFKVRAPDRYVVGPPSDSVRPLAPALRAVERITDAIDIPLRVKTFYLRPQRNNALPTTLAIEVRRDDKSGRKRRMDLLIEARPVEHGRPVRDSAEFTLPPRGQAVVTREMDLAPGLWQARIVISDLTTSGIGSVLHTFEVPEERGLRVSSPILTDQLESHRASRPRVRVDSRYRKDRPLYCIYQVFGATPDPAVGRPRVNAGFTVIHGGRTIREEPPTAIEPTKDGRLLRLVGFGLADLDPGRYSLTLRVSDEVRGEKREIVEPFTVVPAEPAAQGEWEAR